MAEKYGASHVYDFSLGNPNVPALKAVKEAVLSILESEDPGSFAWVYEQQCRVCRCQAGSCRFFECTFWHPIFRT